jgi:ApaG protein
MFTKTTNNIKITAIPHFLAEQSEPEEDRYVWAYTIHMENYGEEMVKLISRHWKITDAKGITQEVRGPGVVGKHPSLKPGESFHYTSGTALGAPSGMMLGSYEMVNEKGYIFQVDVPAFSLDSPYHASKLN